MAVKCLSNDDLWDIFSGISGHSNMGVKCQGGKRAKTELEALSRDSRLRRVIMMECWAACDIPNNKPSSSNIPEMVGINRSQLEVTAFFFVCISSCWTNNLAFKTKPLSGKKRSPIFTSQNTNNCFLTNPSTFLRIQQDISFDKYSVFCWHPILIGSYRWKKNKNVFFPLVIGDVSFFPFQICGLSQSCQSPILLGENPWKSCFRSQFSNPKSQLSHEKSQFSHAKSISEPRSRARSRNQQHSCYLESWRWEHQGLGFEETKRWMVFMGFNKNSWDFMGFYGI